MKSFLRHIAANPFIFATGAAALIHSTWSLGTMMSGAEPAQLTPAWFAWVFPALLIAFSLDIGQIITSAEIRDGQRTPTKFLTFGVLAIATYYLQWVFVAAHIPAIDPAPGVHSLGAAQAMLDLGVWLVPGLLPASTLLYTFSQSRHEKGDREIVTALALSDQPVERESNAEFDSMAVSIEKQIFTSMCIRCGWVSKEKDSQYSADQALKSHGQFCIRAKDKVISKNGVHHE
jgi:Zn ribbon nucleic-acid-binding protein